MSSYWLAKGDLSIESEGFLVATREQVLSTNAIIHLHNHDVSPLCRLVLITLRLYSIWFLDAHNWQATNIK